MTDNKPMNWVFNHSLDDVKKRKEIEDAHTFFDRTFGRGGNPDRLRMKRRDTAMQGLELAGMAAGAFNSQKNAKDLEREAKTNEIVGRQYEQLEEPMKLAAGAEGHTSKLPNVFNVKQQLVQPNTKNMPALEFKRIRDGLMDAERDMRAGFKGSEINPEELDLSEFNELPGKKVAANNQKDVAEAKSGRKALTLSTSDKINEMKRLQKEGYDIASFKEMEDLGKKLREDLRKKPTEIIDLGPKETYSDLKNSTKDKDGNITVKTNGAKNSKDTRDLENSVVNKDGTVNVKKNGKVVPHGEGRQITDNDVVEKSVKYMDNVIGMMDYLDAEKPEQAKEIRERLRSVNGLRLQDGLNGLEGKVRDSQFASKLSKARSMGEQFKSKVEDPTTRKLAEAFEYQYEPTDLASRLAKFGINGIKDKKSMALALATVASQFLFSEEDDDETPEMREKYNQAAYEGVNWNAGLFSGPEAKLAMKYGPVLVNDWLETFSEDDMSPRDVDTYNEIKTLMKDAGDGTSILTNSGQNPVKEVLTNPKYYRMFQKYVSPLNKGIRGW